MTGPWHYREAEVLAGSASKWLTEWGPVDMTSAERLDRKNSDLAAAQVHATLALAAATALPGEHPGDWQREIWAFGPETGPDLEPEEYDPGPEAHDEGGMSDYRGWLP
jgi:hypothetical protein